MKTFSLIFILAAITTGSFALANTPTAQNSECSVLAAREGLAKAVYSLPPEALQKSIKLEVVEATTPAGTPAGKQVYSVIAVTGEGLGGDDYVRVAVTTLSDAKTKKCKVAGSVVEIVGVYE